MNLPPRPPQPTIQITTPIASIPSTTYATPKTSGGSLHGSARSKISSRARPLSRSEFDPIALREEWIRDSLHRQYQDQSRVPTEYSYVVGRPRHKDPQRQPKASISIDIPSPLADRLFSQPDTDREAIWAEILAAHSQWYNFNRPVLPVIPPPPYPPASVFESLEVGCVFAVITLSTLAVFVLLTVVYLKGFVKI